MKEFVKPIHSSTQLQEQTQTEAWETNSPTDVRSKEGD